MNASMRLTEAYLEESTRWAFLPGLDKWVFESGEYRNLKLAYEGSSLDWIAECEERDMHTLLDDIKLIEKLMSAYQKLEDLLDEYDAMDEHVAPIYARQIVAARLKVQSEIASIKNQLAH